MTTLFAEIERLQRVSVQIDIEKFCAVNVDDRAAFDGSDEEYVRSFVNEEAYSLLMDGPTPMDESDGVLVMDEYDETEPSFLGAAA